MIALTVNMCRVVDIRSVSVDIQRLDDYVTDEQGEDSNGSEDYFSNEINYYSIDFCY